MSVAVAFSHAHNLLLRIHEGRETVVKDTHHTYRSYHIQTLQVAMVYLQAHTFGYSVMDPDKEKSNALQK